MNSRAALACRLRPRITLQLWAGIICVAGLFLNGCSTSKPSNAENQFDVVQATRFWQPHLLQVLDTPHPRLCVEVDAVAGCEPSDATLGKLRDFLATYCHKPGGIEIVRSDVIPAEAARGISRRALARKFLTGPPARTNAPPPAFLYFLFYDGRLSDQPPVRKTGETAPRNAPHPPERNKNPHVDFLPYPAAAFINAPYGPKIARDDILLHEAGHLLGLANRPALTSGYHCPDTRCRMNPTVRFHIGRMLFFMDPIKQHELCVDCAAQLRESAKQPAPANLRFVGPVLVRSEAGYHVLSLPTRMKLIIGALTDADCKDFMNAVRTEMPPPEIDGNAMRWDAFAKSENDPATLRAILARAKEDPYEGVRIAATKLEETLKNK